MKEKNKEQNDQRSSKWTFLIYQDSAPENYLQVLEKMCVPFVLSPWHNKDVNFETGEILKSHKHCAFFFDSLKAYTQVSDMVYEQLNAPKHIEVVSSPKGLYHYFTHAENPEKTPYRIEDIEYGCGFEIEKFLVEHNTKEFMEEAIDIIEENDFVEFQDLVMYARNNNHMLLELIIRKTYFFSRLLDSRRYRVDKKAQQKEMQEENSDINLNDDFLDEEA